ncbi:hypothetical protein F2P81_002649 [Scophthalmus maximus]|uniref:Uncharacterized protein n=1 Tax=Scophthalmus maximus TaxID=52904 RepID=A0A6A4TR91_SCOMX|nr:hypothetical protein F2P81_002649 [Scophthalmus maximus]
MRGCARDWERIKSELTNRTSASENLGPIPRFSFSGEQGEEEEKNPPLHSISSTGKAITHTVIFELDV